MNDPAAERLFHARDAYSSGILLSLLVLMAQILSVFTTGTGPQGVPFEVRCALIVVSTSALGYLLATRQRPREAAAWAVCAGLIGTYLLLIPWTAARWRAVGRPWEAFVPPQIAMISLALTVPRSFWLGTVAVLAFLLEGLGILAYFAISGTPRQWLPVTQPAMMILYATVGVAILVARRKRRRLCLQHISAEAEAVTRTRLSSFLPDVIDDLSAQLEVLSKGLSRIVSADRRQIERGQAAVARLVGLRDQLARLVGQPAAREPGCPTRPVSDDAPAPTDVERQLYARDAYQSARVIAIMLLVSMVTCVHAAGQRSSLLQLLWAGHAVVVLICLLILQRTWSRPSERGGNVLCFVMVAPLLVIFVYAQTQWAHGREAFEPLCATKLLMLVLALTAPRHRWLSLALIGLVAAEGFALFYAYHFETLRDRIPWSEPWPLLMHLLIAAALLSTREQRRVASVRILRADREAAAKARHADVVLAVLDRVSSPLQVLVFATAMMLDLEPDATKRDALALAVSKLARIPERMPQIDLRAYDDVDLSPDPEHRVMTH